MDWAKGPESRRLLCESAGLSAATPNPVANPNMMNRKCLRCQVDLPSGRIGLICGHFHCDPCFKSYVETCVNEGPDCMKLTCPIPSCKAAILEHTILMHLKPESQVIYDQLKIKSYEIGRQIKRCPNRKCILWIQLDDFQLTTSMSKNDVTCLCSYTFCFNCLNESHYPVDCFRVSSWISKILSGESDSRFSTFHNHWRNIDLDMGIAVTTLHEIKVSRIKEFRIQNSLFKFMTEAWEELISCKRLLKWSYIYTYYMDEADRGNFEVTQQNFEAGVDYFHQYLKEFTESYSYEVFGGSRTQLIKLTDLAKAIKNKFLAAMEL